MILSSGFVKALAGEVGYHRNLCGGKLQLRTGTPQASADAALTGTLLATLTKNGGTHTPETLAEWKATLTGSSGAIDSVMICGGITRSGTAQAGAAGTITLDASASATDDIYNGMVVKITGGTGSGQVRKITDYVGSTKVATVSPNWGTNPDATSTFEIRAGIELLSSAVNFTTDLATTAAALATAINNSRTVPDFEARSNGADVYVKAPIGSGASLNNLVLVIATSTMGATINGDGTPSGSGGTVGVAAVNGLDWQFPPVNGVLSKESNVWQDSSADASGTVGYAVLILDKDDDFGATSVFRRVIFTVGASGADITSQVLTTTQGTPAILNTFGITIPSTAA